MVPPEMKRADLGSILRDPLRKRHYVRELFDRVAPTYDRFTRCFSYGMDGAWKRELAAAVASRIPPAATVLDLACGTADLAVSIRSVRPDARVFGSDLSRVMLSRARRRTGCGAVVRSDMGLLPFPDGSAHAVLAGYAFRNAPDLAEAIREVARVLKNGGWLGSLDFYLPSGPILRTLFLRYLKAAGSIYGWSWHRDPGTYAYLAHSLRLFLTATQFGELLARHGFECCEVREKLKGGIAIHLARKASRCATT